MKLIFVWLVTFAVAVFAQDFEYEAPARRPAPARLQSSFAASSSGPKPTPVAILKQINRHNEDGSYTYGYESADGSFKIETKSPTGEVKGKYGFVDDTGKVRTVEYGATKYGFEPSGEGITVAPPTLVDETTNKDGTVNAQYNDQYYEPEPAPLPPPRPALRPRPRPAPQPSYDTYTAPQQFSPAPQSFREASPVPARPSIPGASLSIDYIPQTKPPAARGFAPTPLRSAPQFSFQPSPVQEEDNYAEPAPAPRPAPKITYAQPAPLRTYTPSQATFQPEPQYAPSPIPAPRPAPVQRQSGGGILDQLAKDYALPQGGAQPLHDISFGYY